MKHDVPIRVMVADDHTIVRTGIMAVLRLCEDFELVGEAGNGLEAVEVAARTHPDVILMDITMPVVDGPTAAKLICKNAPETKVLFLTSHKDEMIIEQALSAGAAGYLLKEVEAHELAAAIRTVYNGELVLAPKAAQVLMQRATQQAKPQLGSDLTKREQDVLRLLAKGCHNRQIAQVLELSQGTIKLHVSNILTKLRVTSRTEAAAIAMKFNLLTE